MSRSRRGIELALLIGVAVGLRAWGLGDKSLWLDEAYSLDRAAPGHSVADVVRITALADAHPPLYYLLLHLWIGVAGQGPCAVRALSAIASAGSVALVHHLLGRVVRPGWALGAALLFAASAFQIEYAAEARHYAILELIVLGAFAAFWGAFRTERSAGGARAWRLPAMHGVLVAAALYTFLYSLFVGFAFGVAALAILVRGGTDERRVAWRLVVCQVAAVVTFLPWLPVVLERRTEFRELAPATGWSFAYPGMKIPDTVRVFVAGSREGPPGTLAVAASLVTLGLVVSGTVLVIRGRSRPERLSFLVLSILPLALIAALPYRAHEFDAKHAIFLAPLATVALATVFDRVAIRGRPPRAVAVLVLVGLVSSNLYCAWLDHAREKEDWNGAAEFLESRLAPGDLVLADPERTLVPLEYALDLRGVRFRAVSGVGRSHPGWESRISAARSRVWLVEVEASPLARSTGLGGRALEEAGLTRVLETRVWDGLRGRVRLALMSRP